MRPKSLIDKFSLNQNLYRCFLALLFVVAFALPLIFAFTIGGFVRSFSSDDDDSGQVTISPDQESAEKDLIFPDAYQISGQNSYISVKSEAWIEPEENKDFLMIIWLKPRKLPSVGERQIILSKFDERSASRKGYALAWTREHDTVKPEIYWRDENFNGTWLTFSDIELEPRYWTMFAISYRKNRFLGLHAATLKGNDPSDLAKAEIKLLGGYELQNHIIPSAKSDLYIGSHENGKYRGKIGPIGIFHLDFLTENLNILLKHFVTQPKDPPEDILAEQIGLWLASQGKDTSGRYNKTEFVKAKRNDRD